VRWRAGKTVQKISTRTGEIAREEETIHRTEGLGQEKKGRQLDRRLELVGRMVRQRDRSRRTWSWTEGWRKNFCSCRKPLQVQPAEPYTPMPSAQG